MKSYDDIPAHKPQNNVPRAKMYLRTHLHWLWGYPLPPISATFSLSSILYWQVLHYPLPWDAEHLILTEEHLAQGSVAYNRAKHSFPKALPQVVGDVKLWSSRVVLKLQALRQLLEGKARQIDPWQALLLPEQGQARLLRQVQQLKRQAPELVELLDSFAWWLSLDPKALQQAVDWIEQQQSSLTVLMQRFVKHPLGTINHAINICAMLFALQRDIPAQHLNNFLQVIAHPVWDADGILAYKRIFAAHYRDFERFPNCGEVDIRLPQDNDYPEFMASWKDLLHQFMAATHKEVRHYLDVVNTLFSAELLDDWLDWCQDSRDYLETVLKELARQRLQQQAEQWMKAKKYLKKDHLPKELVYHWRKYWRMLDRTSPTLPNRMDPLFERLAYIANEPKLLASLLKIPRILERLPEDHPWRKPDLPLKLATHWHLLKLQEPHAPQYVKVFVPAWLDYLQQAKTPEALAQRLLPWQGLDKYYGKLEKEHSVFKCWELRVIYAEQQLRHYSAFLSLLASLCEAMPERIDYELVSNFHNFYKDTPKHWPKLDYFRILLEHQLEFSLQENVCGWLDRLLQDDRSAEHFLTLIQDWKLAANEESPLSCWEAFAVAPTLLEQGHAALLNKVRQLEAWSLLAPLKPTIQQLEQAKLPIPVLTKYSLTESFADYPAELQPALQFLASYVPQAQQTARRILVELHADKVSLTKQLAFIQQRLQQDVLTSTTRARLEITAANLAKRLSDPELECKTLSQQRLNNLSGKLYHAALTTSLTLWRQACEQLLKQHLHTMLHVEYFDPSWLQNKQDYQTLIALTNLSASERRLAGQLLQAELDGNYPLFDAPANQAWIARMRAQGFNLQPWLEGFELNLPMIVGEQVKTFTLRLAQRLFDVLHMGDHFDTCLSHDGCNFFSVLANAADINKRVLYAYDARGTVQGRCLLAISNEGRLLHFHPYTHLMGEQFEQAVNQVMNYLEKVTGIPRHVNGDISTLVARHWYNDGVVNSSNHAVFARGSEFRRSLKAKALVAEKVFANFQAALESEPLSNLLLLQLIDLPELINHYPVRLSLSLYWLEQGLLNYAMQRELFEHLLQRSPWNVDIYPLWPLVKDWVWDYLYYYLQKNDVFPATELTLLTTYQPLQALKLFKVLHQKIKRISYAYHRIQLEANRAKIYLALNRPRQALAICQATRRSYSDECAYYLDPIETEVKQRLEEMKALVNA